MNEFGKMKGQAAIEYLMNYGWAILILVVVFVALFFVVGPLLGGAEQCTTDVRFSCNDPLPYVSNDGAGDTEIDVRLYNRQVQAIDIKKVLCTVDSSIDVTNAADVNPTIRISSGSGFADFTDIACKQGADALKLTQGDQFKGTVVFWYTEENAIDPNDLRTLSASVVAKVN
ncbi:hypothetical protein KJ780_05105 [Candidatus Micrarchaeota archaeon]|nr:hypothetical protein [Candidatus Micrarchaeota archaeon]